MPRGSLRRSTAWVLAALASAAALPLLLPPPVQAAARPARPPSHAAGPTGAAPGILLALGDSLAAGYQPTDGHRPPPTDPATGLPDAGYPGGYAADLARAEHLRLIDLGCPGETSASFTTHPAQGACTRGYEAMTGTGNQLAAALAELAAHRGQVALVTFDLGGNDVDACVHGGSLDPACLARVPATLATRLPRILDRLRAALHTDDPTARLVAMDYYDPFLALAYRPGGLRGDALAAASLGGITAVNEALQLLYRRQHVLVAPVASAFSTGSILPFGSYDGSRLPKDVAAICRLTWMCPAPHPRPGTPGQNVHPTTAGYAAIARAFEQTLARR